MLDFSTVLPAMPPYHQTVSILSTMSTL